MPFLNISTYRFVELDDLPALRERMETSAIAAGIKGTILVAHEGINLFVAGEEAALRGWVAGALHAEPPFAGLATKDSFSDTMPFKRLKVKIKNELIRMNHPTIRPQQGRAASVEPATLARWLAQGRDDEGRALALLDTRNAFEVDAGTFEGALDWRLEKFSDFPAAFDAHRAELAGKTVVSFCTGGIRCEKAALYMGERALPGVLQLEGGILGYFAATGGAAPGWTGHCFVFDERRTVAADLAPGGPPPSERAVAGADIAVASPPTAAAQTPST